MAGRIAVLTVVLWATLALPARAADATLSPASPTHTWEGGPHSGAGGLTPLRCTALVYECEDVLLEITHRGRLTIDIKAGAGSQELDLRLYASDAQGTVPAGSSPLAPARAPIAEDDRTERDARLSVRLPEPGFYVAQVSFVEATQGVYRGIAAFVPAILPPPPLKLTAADPGAAQTAPPAAAQRAAAARRKKALQACNRRARRFTSRSKRRKALRACARRHRAERG